MAHKNWEKANAPYAERLRELLRELGAEETDCEFWPFVFQTKAGTYKCIVYPNDCHAGAWVAGRFKDVERATAFFKGGANIPNPYSGKWNHHYFDTPVEHAVRDLREQMRKVLQ